MSFTTEDLEKLRAELPAGAVKQLSEMFQVKENSIHQYLSGRRKRNQAILVEAVRIAKAHKASVASLQSDIASL